MEADSIQIEQVLLNIYVNAWLAMPGSGELYLEMSEVNLDDIYCLPHTEKPGRYTKYSVTDTGIGMDKATLQRIFNPFSPPRKKVAEQGWGWLRDMAPLKTFRDRHGIQRSGLRNDVQPY